MTETQTYVPRLKQHYDGEIRRSMREEFGYANPMQIPRLEKIVVNMGVGEATGDSKLINGAVDDMTRITGQKLCDQRIVFPWIGCGDCDACRRDDELLCHQPRTIGTRRDGGYSDHVMVPHPRYLVDYSGVPEDRYFMYRAAGG